MPASYCSDREARHWYFSSFIIRKSLFLKSSEPQGTLQITVTEDVDCYAACLFTYLSYGVTSVKLEWKEFVVTCLCLLKAALFLSHVFISNILILGFETVVTSQLRGDLNSQ